jgi:membrane fusion protein (multidrug efflux system)
MSDDSTTQLLSLVPAAASNNFSTAGIADAYRSDWRGAGFAVDFHPETQVAGLAASAPTPASAQHSVQRSRRRIIGMALVVVTVLAGNGLWSATFQNPVLGVVAGQQLALSAEGVEGTIEEVFVREGERVEHGQPLLLLKNKTWQQELDRLRDELRVATAEIAATESQLQWQQEVAENSGPRARADFHEAQGRLHDEEARLEVLEAAYKRYEQLRGYGSVSADVLERARLEWKGQSAKVAQLQKAAAELQTRADQADALSAGRDVQLAPRREQVAYLQAEIGRWEEKIVRLQVRSPVEGVVLARLHHTGEWIGRNEALFSLLRRETQEIVLYVPQSKARAMQPGDRLTVDEESRGGRLTGTIERIDPYLQKPPESISEFYRHGEDLVTVHVAPGLNGAAWPELPLGGVVRLPWYRLWMPHWRRT